MYFRPGVDHTSKDVMRNEDYFYSEDDVLNNLRVSYGIINIAPSIKDGHDEDDSIGVGGRLRRTTKPALSASAEKENKKPLRAKRKDIEQSSPASSQASSVHTSVSNSRIKRAKTTSSSSSSATEAPTKRSRPSKNPLTTIREADENKIATAVAENADHCTDEQEQLTLEQAILLADRDLSANHDSMQPVGRKMETDMIYNQLVASINSLAGGSIYVCGSPGVGKTFSINGILKILTSMKTNQDNGDGNDEGPLRNDFMIIRGQGTSMGAAYQHLVCDPVNKAVFPFSEDRFAYFYHHTHKQHEFQAILILILLIFYARMYDTTACQNIVRRMIFTII